MSNSRPSSTPAGTVLEIPLGGKLREFVPPFAYAIVTHQIEGWGQVVRVFDWISEAPIQDPTPLAGKEEFYGVYINIESALRQGLVRKVGCMDLPNGFERLPLIRCRDMSAQGDRWMVRQGDEVVLRDQILTPALKRLGHRGWYPLGYLVTEMRERLGLEPRPPD